MTDREKVINGLKLCDIGSGNKCYETECPYYQNGCTEQLKNDLLVLLNEQEPVKPVDVHMFQKMYVKVRSGYCPICYNPVDEEEGNNFCCSCGRRLNWDG